MGINHYWDEQDPSLLYFEVVGAWTWLECRQVADDLFGFLRDEKRHVDCVVDMRHAGAIPNGNDDQCMRRTLDNAPSTLGLVVLVGADRFTRMVLSIMQKHSPIIERKILLADSFQDAHHTIAAHRTLTS